MENKSTIGAEKINALFDAGTFVEIGSYVRRSNRPEEYEGVVCGYGAVDGKLVFAFSQDSDRMKGAFDEIHARKIEKLYEMAIANGAPVVAMLDSAGAVIYDGSAVLSGYGRVMKCVSEASGIIPQIVCLMTFMNSIIKLIGEDRVDNFASKIGGNVFGRYLLMPIMGMMFLCNPMAYSFGRFLKEEHKPGFYDAEERFMERGWRRLTFEELGKANFGLPENQIEKEL